MILFWYPKRESVFLLLNEFVMNSTCTRDKALSTHPTNMKGSQPIERNSDLPCRAYLIWILNDIDKQNNKYLTNFIILYLSRIPASSWYPSAYLNSVPAQLVWSEVGNGKTEISPKTRRIYGIQVVAGVERHGWSGCAGELLPWRRILIRERREAHIVWAHQAVGINLWAATCQKQIWPILYGQSREDLGLTREP